MNVRVLKPLFTALLILILSVLLSACDLTPGEIIIGLSGACDVDPLVVTKYEDTDDGICTEDDCSLREAVITANTCAGLQRIELPAGSYTLSIVGRGEDQSRTGDLDITEKVDLIGRGTGASINAAGIDRVIHIIEGPDLEEPHITLLKNLTLAGGAADDVGGGVYVQGANLLANDLVLLNNQAGSPGGVGGAGGGFYFEQGGMTSSGLVVEGNTAHGPGGGGYIDRGTWIADGEQIFRENRSTGGRGGGGVYLSADTRADLVDVEFIENETEASGGGIWNAGELQVHRQVKFGINQAGARGGGLYNAPGGSADLQETWFTNNTAEEGGGLFNAGSLTLLQSGVNNNTAFAGLGGGVFNDGGAAEMLIRNTTISANMVDPAHEGGGSGIINNSGTLQIEFSTLAYNNTNGIFNRAGSVQLANTILGHHGGDNCAGGSVSSGGYNLEDASSCGLAGSGDLEVDRLMIEWLALNGGFSLNHALGSESPALNAADPADCPAVDQRGVSRPQGERCDRGAFESKEHAEGGSDTAPATAVPTAAPTAAPTATPTPTPTPAVSITPELEEPTGTLEQNAFCRTGPGTVYPAVTAYEAGTELVIEGQNEFEPRWWRVVVPSTGGSCWISDALLKVSGPAAEVPEFKAPPTPTPTKTPVPVTPSPTYQQ